MINNINKHTAPLIHSINCNRILNSNCYPCVNKKCENYPVYGKNQYCFDWLTSNLSKEELIDIIKKDPEWLEFI